MCLHCVINRTRISDIKAKTKFTDFILKSIQLIGFAFLIKCNFKVIFVRAVNNFKLIEFLPPQIFDFLHRMVFFQKHKGLHREKDHFLLHRELGYNVHY